MELTAKIPSSLKLRGDTNKYIFKKALEKILPAEILNRPKMGFAMPVESWFKKELLPHLKATILSSKAISRSPLPKIEIERLIENHVSGKNNYANQLWTLLMLEEWYKQYFD